MKLLFTLALISAVIIVKAQSSGVIDSAVMGANYANDVFYSLKTGNKYYSDRMNWDIAFRTNIMSSSILTNGGSGVHLYTYPKADTQAWSNIDTTGLYTWKPMYNSLKDWEKGAFMAHAGNHPDYGWGVYNSSNHKLHGDSIFIIQLSNQAWKKIWIVQKDSPKNIYYFRIANIDGSNDTLITINCNNFKAKEFVGFSLVNMQIADREPIIENWDLLFTKYMDKVYMGPSPVDYPVIGVLSSAKTQVVKVKGYEETTYEDYASHTFEKNNISLIGRDWKATNGQPPVYSMVDSLLYFIKTADSSIYKLYFTDFISGTSGDGRTVFVKKQLGNSSVKNLKSTNQQNISIYPNPASKSAHLIYDYPQQDNIRITVIDAFGHLVLSQNYTVEAGFNVIALNIESLKSGVYFVSVSNGSSSSNTRLLVQ